MRQKCNPRNERNQYNHCNKTQNLEKMEEAGDRNSSRGTVHHADNRSLHVQGNGTGFVFKQTRRTEHITERGTDHIVGKEHKGTIKLDTTRNMLLLLCIVSPTSC